MVPWPWIQIRLYLGKYTWASQVALGVRNPPANAGNSGLIPGSGRSPGGGNGNPLQYSCLENPMDSPRVAKSWTKLSTAHTGKHKALLRKIKEDPDKRDILFISLKAQYYCQFLLNWCINSTQFQSKAQQLKSDCKSLKVSVAQSCKCHIKVEGPRLVKLTKLEAYQYLISRLLIKS